MHDTTTQGFGLPSHEISELMADSNPVFIVGDARSGTSILYRLLQQHPSFRCKTLDLTESYAFSLVGRSACFTRHYPRRLQAYLLNDRAIYMTFLRSTRRDRYSTPLRVISTRWSAGRVTNVTRAYFYYARLARGCQRLVEKTAYNLPYFDDIVTTFPRAKLLFIARHPIDVFTSYRKRAQRDPRATWANLSTDTFLRHYTSTLYQALTKQSDHSQSFRLLRYDELTSSTERYLGDVFDFLGERAPVNLTQETPSIDWPPDPHLFGPVVATTKAWRDFISPTEARVIENATGELLDSLGFPRYT